MTEPRRLTAEMRERYKRVFENDRLAESHGVRRPRCSFSDEKLEEIAKDALHDLDVLEGELVKITKDKEYWFALHDEERVLLTEANRDLATAQATSIQRDAQIAAMRGALNELHATVKGECPSLLDEDRGGSARLDLEIRCAQVAGLLELVVGNYEDCTCNSPYITCIYCQEVSKNVHDSTTITHATDCIMAAGDVAQLAANHDAQVRAPLEAQVRELQDVIKSVRAIESNIVSRIQAEERRRVMEEAAQVAASMYLVTYWDDPSAGIAATIRKLAAQPEAGTR